MPQVVPNVCVSGSSGTLFGGFWEAVVKSLGGCFGASGGRFGASWGLLEAFALWGLRIMIWQALERQWFYDSRSAD